MARVALTEEQARRILESPKAASEDVRWVPRGTSCWVGCRLNVENQLKVTLHIHANANLIDRAKYSFSLILSNSYRIASFDAGASHINRHSDSNRWLGQPHKHRWTENCRDSFAYTPTDIDHSTLESAFRSFCREIGVDFTGTVEPLPATQQSMGF